LSTPVVVADSVAVGDLQGYIHFLSREDGSFAARQKTDGTPVRAPLQTLGSAAVLVQTTGGEVSAFEVQ
jgi:outer membrane protein assembly factor BamB